MKSKSASYEQRFIVAGAASGNGTYAGEVPSSADVSGDSWTITIQNNPGDGWVNSDDQITFPTASGGYVRFDIESNDAGGDEDFNDLILTCSTPESASEFIIYGNVSCYEGLCIFNPCWRRWIVIDTAEALQLALANPLLRAPIKELYPERIKPIPPRPDLEPVPFTPLVLPLLEDTALPPKLGRMVKTVDVESQEVTKRTAKGKKAAETEPATRLVAGESITLSQSERLVADFNRVAIADLVDKLHFRCSVEELAGFVLRFQEYDRTGAELTGGPYTGDGSRENLGLTVTDRNGNYIFRFSRTSADIGQEILEDVPTGGDPFVQSMPDVIAQLMDFTLPTGVAHETAPYWNINNLRRINICIPCNKVPRPKGECKGVHRLESIGHIRIGLPANTFDPDGRITATDTSVPVVPQARCAAWGGYLSFFGCLGKSVKYYTIEWRRRLTGGGWTKWEYYEEKHSLYNKVALAAVKVGPFLRDLNVSGDPGLEKDIPAYDNHEEGPASDWALSEQGFKAVVNTVIGPYAPSPATVEFRIQGYDSSKQPVDDGLNSTVRLYINNNAPDLEVAEVTMDGQTGGVCALFDLSEASMTPAVMTVRFKAIHDEGLLNNYSLSIRKGNIPGNFPIATTVGPALETSAALSNSYAHGSATSCNELYGTRFPDEPTAVGDYATAYIIPNSPATNWLEAGQAFCTFSIRVSTSWRVTNGYNRAVYTKGPIQYLLGIQA